MLDIEVIYATEQEQMIFSLQMPSGSTIEQAILASGVLSSYPEIDLTSNAVGVFSQKKQLDDVLCAGDRVEIYRSLIADPKQVRRTKANVQKENKQFI